MKTKKTTTKRRKRRQNDEYDDSLQKDFSPLSTTRAKWGAGSKMVPIIQLTVAWL